MGNENKHTPARLTTSRADMDSFTANEEGVVEHVVYIYRGDQPRIPVFAGPLNNAREDAARLALAWNTHDQMLEALKLAYRKHSRGDESIGWQEVEDAMLHALCEAMGDEGYQAWAKTLNPVD